MRDLTTKTRITVKTLEAIKKLAKKMNLKQITILEYLLSGKINLEDLWKE